MPNIKWDDVNESESLEKGTYLARIASWKRAVSKNQSLMVEVAYKIQEPMKYAGVTIRDRFVVGVPGVGDADQWGMVEDDVIDGTSVGTKILKQTMKAAHVPTSGETEIGETLESALDQDLIIYVENEIYDGKARPNVKGHFAIGEREVRIEEEVTVASPSPVTRLAARRQRIPATVPRS